ncbi:MAG: gluconolactonase [Chloroflexi bacterium]|nr:MAG: gluconolactonase [Chloroflexota bacterium]
MRIEDDHGISDLLRGTESRLCSGFGFTEGPVWIPTDKALLFSDIPGNRMHRWRPGQSEAEVYRAPSGWSNGLTLDAEGNVLACEHGGRRVSRIEYGDSRRSVALAERWDGKALNSPNDLVVHSSGAIFFTDPTYGADTGKTPSQGAEGQTPELDFQGVYRIDPDGALHCVVREGFSQPNGLALARTSPRYISVIRKTRGSGDTTLMMT